MLMKRIYIKIKNVLFIALLLIVGFCYKNYSADLTLNATYGINNNARSGSLLPLEINITNYNFINIFYLLNKN